MPARGGGNWEFQTRCLKFPYLLVAETQYPTPQLRGGEVPFGLTVFTIAEGSGSKSW